jgi:hypothetical protein
VDGDPEDVPADAEAPDQLVGRALERVVAGDGGEDSALGQEHAQRLARVGQAELAHTPENETAISGVTAERGILGLRCGCDMRSASGTWRGRLLGMGRSPVWRHDHQNGQARGAGPRCPAPAHDAMRGDTRTSPSCGQRLIHACADAEIWLKPG